MANLDWWLRLFGEPALEGPDGVLTLRTTRQLGVLLYAALEGPRVRREQLVPLFWPDAAEKRGRHSLTQALSELRSAVPGLVTSERGYLVVRGLGTELDDLGAHPSRVERGEILEAIDGLGGIELAQWLDGVRQRIRRDGTRLIEAALQSAPDEGARATAARAILRLDPAHEQAAIILAEQELDAGRTTDAVRYLRRHQHHVVSELGYDPQPRVGALLERLQSGDAARARRAIMGDSLHLTAPEEPVVGREAELALLSQAWDDVCAGTNRSLRFTGNAGMGKSLLLRSFMAGLASRGHLAFLVTCHQATRAVPFALLADLIDALAQEPGFVASDPVWLAELSRIHPALRRRFPGIPEPPEAPPESIRERLVEATTSVLAAVSDGAPIALGVDDVEQGDHASLSVLGLVLRRVHTHATLLLTSSLDTPGATADVPFDADRHLLLGPMTETHIRRLILTAYPNHPRFIGDTTLLEVLSKIADGNPHFALCLARDHTQHEISAQAFPPGVDWVPPHNLLEAVGRSIERHSTLARRVLAVLGARAYPATVDAVAKVAGVTCDEARAAMVELLASDRVKVSGETFRVASPLLQSVIYRMETLPLRQYLHSRWAKVLMTTSDLAPQERLLAAARHEELAGEASEAYAHLVEGARIAVEEGALSDARSCLEHALTLAVDDHTVARSKLAATLCAQGRHEESLAALDCLQHHVLHGSYALTVEDRIVALEARQRLGRTPLDDVLAELMKLTRSHRAQMSVSQQLRVHQLRAEIARERGDMDDLDYVLHEVQDTGAVSPVDRARRTLTTGFIRWERGFFRAAYRQLANAFEEFGQLHIPQEACRAANGAAVADYAAGRLNRAMEWFAKALETAELCGNTDMAAGIIGNAGVCVEDAGLLKEAFHLNELAIDIAVTAGATKRLLNAQLNQVDVLLLSGRVAEAVALHEEAAAAADEVGDDVHRLQSTIKRPDLYMALGDVGRAVEATAGVVSAVRGLVSPVFVRSRVIRQTCSAAFHSKGAVNVVDPLRGRGVWTAFGRKEACTARAWLAEAHGKQKGLLDRTIAAFQNTHGHLEWFRATGLLLETPWVQSRSSRHGQKPSAVRHESPESVAKFLLLATQWSPRQHTYPT